MPSVQSRKTIFDVIRDHEKEIRALGVQRIGIFGSFSRDEHDEESDVDVLVEFDPAQKTFDNFINLSFLLEELFERPVELVTRESLSPYIGPHILKEVWYASLNS